MPLIPQTFIELLILCQTLFEAIEGWGPTWKHVELPLSHRWEGCCTPFCADKRCWGGLRDILWGLSV